jgi:hypothetical protein
MKLIFRGILKIALKTFIGFIYEPAMFLSILHGLVFTAISTSLTPPIQHRGLSCNHAELFPFQKKLPTRLGAPGAVGFFLFFGLFFSSLFLLGFFLFFSPFAIPLPPTCTPPIAAVCPV